MTMWESLKVQVFQGTRDPQYSLVFLFISLWIIGGNSHCLQI
uniref:Uncharacterized protein n=1 Tax=Anguilla anguilla TaxID=7936 RepID=A0A0E9QR95_ANGAN